MEVDYIINSEQLGKDKHSKVYRIKNKFTKEELIVKIYENPRIIHYNNETNILNLLNNNYPIQENPENNFYLMYKDIPFYNNMFIIQKEIKGENNEFLFYDYLPKLSLLDYVNNINEKIKEIHTKYLCFKILKAIEKMQAINICHNKIDISNIMFDDYYNPKIIHFSEANEVNDKNKLNKDIFNLGKILAKIFSLGKFTSINFNKKTNEFIIFYNNIGKKEYMQENKFWIMLKNIYDINISEQFLNFFHVIIDAGKNNNIININDLLKNEWLNEINNNFKTVEENFKKDFNELYVTIIEDNIKNSSIEIDIENILEEKEKNIEYHLNNSLFNNFLNLNIPQFKLLSGLESNCINDYGSNLSITFEKENSDKKEIKIEEKQKINKKNVTEEKIKSDSKKKNNIEKSFLKKKIITFEKDTEKKTIIKKRKIKSRKGRKRLNDYFKYKKNMNKKNIENDFEQKEKEELKDIQINYIKNEDKEDIKSDSKLMYFSKNYSNDFEKIFQKEENKNKKETKIEGSKIEEKGLMSEKEMIEEKIIYDINTDNYILRGNKKNMMDSLNYISKEEDNFYKQRKEDFNYLEINIKNNNNKDINKATINFIIKLKEKIKEEYLKKEINIKYEEENEYSFKICYEIPPMNFPRDEIVFLDEDFEKIINLQKYYIKVNLIEGNKSLYSTNKINQYYLIFNSTSNDKEDFFVLLKELRSIVKNLY